MRGLETRVHKKITTVVVLGQKAPGLGSRTGDGRPQTTNVRRSGDFTYSRGDLRHSRKTRTFNN